MANLTCTEWLDYVCSDYKTCCTSVSICSSLFPWSCKFWRFISMTNNRLSCSCSQNSPGLPWVWDKKKACEYLKPANLTELHSKNKPQYSSEGLSWEWTPPIDALTHWTASALTSSLQPDPEFTESSDWSLQSQVWHDWSILDQSSIN